ncbi:GNAT family N-acetyltransferase [Jiangella anatolica]|uniref:GNAT family N-acetyltransferase n=1 Tax=Jiangella anatolica TaxID=2670374 RepID=A0A2W2AYH1_9ACTN|nr:GNAT family protein [Jiangella anatolica]PZF80245.1 GNAT family N-acetyltransferase [Jiangella anatolica]
MNDPHVLLSGERLALGLPRAEGQRSYQRWENDPATIHGHGARLRPACESPARAGRGRFELVRLSDSAPVGLSVLRIDQAARTAEFTMLLAPAARGQGLGTEAAVLTLDWAFHAAALRMVWLTILEPNVPAIRAYEWAGFRTAGRLRDAGWWRGEPCDGLLMDAVRADFPGPSRVPADVT